MPGLLVIQEMLTPLQETHVKFDCETTDGEPNTLLHHLLAIYSLGAPAETIKVRARPRRAD